MATPTDSPGHSPRVSTEQPPEPSPRNPARMLHPITTNLPTDTPGQPSASVSMPPPPLPPARPVSGEDRGRNDLLGLMPPPPTRQASNDSRERPNPSGIMSLPSISPSRLSASSSNLSSPTGMMGPPPPPPSRQLPSRGSIAESPGGSEYPATVPHSHPVSYPALHDALDGLNQDSGAGGLPSPQSSISPPTRPPSSTAYGGPSSQQPDRADPMRTAIRSPRLYDNVVMDEQEHLAYSAVSEKMREARDRDRAPYSDFTLFSNGPRMDAQLDGDSASSEAAYPDLSELEDSMARTSLLAAELFVSAPPRRNVPRVTAQSQRAAQPSPTELAMMRSAASSAQIRRPSNTRRLETEQTISPSTHTSTAAAEEVTAGVLPAPLFDGAGTAGTREAVTYPTLQGARLPSVPGGTPVERLDSTAGEGTTQEGMTFGVGKGKGKAEEGEVEGFEGRGGRGKGSLP